MSDWDHEFDRRMKLSELIHVYPVPWGEGWGVNAGGTISDSFPSRAAAFNWGYDHLLAKDIPDGVLDE